ncbi:MAG: hypothetical protein LBV03_07385 [Fusobacteriales bacterium]|jgi:hypothetical protein|nr:hypothetical protein [Fusobacteriales bacterium]
MGNKGTFRQIYTSFWRNTYIQDEMTPEDKYFYLYLLTNDQTKQIGVYQVTQKQIAFDTGYSRESIKALLHRFEEHHKLIKYSPDTKEIAILKWGGLNFNKGGKPIECLLEKEFKETKNKELIKLVMEDIENENIKEFLESLFVKYDTCNDSYHDTPDDTYHDSSKNDEVNKTGTSYDTYHDTYDDTGGINNNKQIITNNTIEEEEKKNDPLGRVKYFFETLIKNQNLEINEMETEILIKNHYSRLYKYDMRELKKILENINKVRFINEQMREKAGNDKNFVAWIVNNRDFILIGQYQDRQKKDGKKNEKFAGNNRGEPNKGWSQFN